MVAKRRASEPRVVATEVVIQEPVQQQQAQAEVLQRLMVARAVLMSHDADAQVVLARSSAEITKEECKEHAWKEGK